MPERGTSCPFKLHQRLNCERSEMHTRRQLMQTAATVAGAVLVAGRQSAVGQSSAIACSLPIGLPGRILGDGFLIRHGFAMENTWYLPGWLHAGEDCAGYGDASKDNE